MPDRTVAEGKGNFEEYRAYRKAEARPPFTSVGAYQAASEVFNIVNTVMASAINLGVETTVT
jgi:hypothetical protein